jgi:aryl-alcohol dehydrogenase-like predicted oxidoreductase
MAEGEVRRVGASGLVVSRMGLGCNNFGMKIDRSSARGVIDAAIDSGVTLFDTADSYGESEEVLGEALAGRRDQVVLTSKFGLDVGGGNGPDWGARGSRRYIRKAIERSLRRLRTDWIDLYQLHYPDSATPIAETLSALSDLVREGKVRYIGASNMRGWHIGDADWTARTNGFERFVSVQRSYSLLDRSVELELVPACQHYGVGLLPYFPLASGLLTGKYRRGVAPDPTSRMGQFAWAQRQLSDQQFGVVEKLEAFAAARGVDLLSVALGWMAHQPAVASVIAGATSPEQVAANVKASFWVPSTEDLGAIDEIAPPPSRAPSVSSSRVV